MGLITDDIRSTAQAALDSLLAPPELGGLGKHCRLIFPPRRPLCPNCGWDAQNKRSNGRYKAGGPQPFPGKGLCPVCNGRGTLDEEVSQDIVLGINWKPRAWVAMPGMDLSNVNLDVPGGACQAKGFQIDLPRVLQSRKLMLESGAEGRSEFLYILHGQPIDAGNIIQLHYFYSIWVAARS